MRFISIIFLALGLASNAYCAIDPAKLAQQKACFTCHKTDQKLIGPSYKEIATKYKNDKTAEAKLIEKVKRGGTGIWGNQVMPPNPQASDDEIKILVKWVLSQK